MSTATTTTKPAAKTSAKGKKLTIEQLEKKLISLGLKPVELPANATKQSRKFYDPKANVAYITFTTGHVARTIEGEGGKRVTMNSTKEGSLVMLATENARLNRILTYLTADAK